MSCQLEPVFTFHTLNVNCRLSTRQQTGNWNLVWVLRTAGIMADGAFEAEDVNATAAAVEGNLGKARDHPRNGQAFRRTSDPMARDRSERPRDGQQPRAAWAIGTLLDVAKLGARAQTGGHRRACGKCSVDRQLNSISGELRTKRKSRTTLQSSLLALVVGLLCQRNFLLQVWLSLAYNFVETKSNWIVNFEL